MQRLLVICTLGLGLSLTQGCATQDLPFSTAPVGGAVAETPPPYQPQSGTVRDGKTGASVSYGRGAPVNPSGYSTPAPSGYATPPPGLPAASTPSPAYGSDSGNTTPNPSHKPIVTSPTGLKEREL